LESANVKLAAMATDVLGASGRALLEALLGGEQDPVALAELARGRLRAKLPQLRQVLEGRVRPVHLVLVRVLLAHIEFLEGALAELQGEIKRLLGPFADAVALAQTLPGVGETAAVALIAAVGTDMDRFPTHRHLASWAGVCPGHKQSGGTRLRGATTQGNSWLQALLGEVAWAIARTSGNYLSAQFHRLARRRGKQKAVVAVRVAQRARHPVPHVARAQAIHRPGGGLLRSPRSPTPPAPACPSSRAAGLHGDAHPDPSCLRARFAEYFRENRPPRGCTRRVIR
jgi:transposase